MKHKIELDWDKVESIFSIELKQCLVGMERELKLRKKGGMAIFSNDKEEDLQRIQQIIDALKLVIDYYSVSIEASND